MAASLLLGLMATHMGASPPAWPPAVHMSGHVNGTTGIMGIEVGPVTGPFEMWTSCDPQQPAQGKMKIIATTTAYGVTVLNTTVAQDCTPTTTTAGKLYENVAVPYLPEVCVGIDIPKAGVDGDLGFCTSCPTYGGTVPTQCAGWTSTPDTIILPSGVSRSCTKYSSTGCKNQTIISDPTVGVTESMLTSVDVWYPDGGQDPLRIVLHQQLWETLPNIPTPIYTVQQSTMDITKFEVGSLSPAAFRHCTPINN